MSIWLACSGFPLVTLTSGEEILTFLAFSVNILSSSTYDSRKRVYVKVSMLLLPGLQTVATYLNVVLGELFRKRATACSGRVHSVIYGNLAILVVEPSIYVFAAFLQNLLAEHDRRRRCVGEEVVLGNTTAGSNRCATIVSEMKDPSLHAEPEEVVSLATLCDSPLSPE